MNEIENAHNEDLHRSSNSRSCDANVSGRQPETHPLPFEHNVEHTAPFISPKRMTREQALAGTPEDRLYFLENEVFVRTPMVQHILEVGDHLFKTAGDAPRLCGMRISGKGGTGKNKIMSYFLRQYPPRKQGSQLIVPVLNVDFRSHKSITAVLHHLLDQLHTVYAKSWSLPELEDTLMEAVVECGTKAIIFNECQHLLYVSKSTQRHKARVSGEGGDWLKAFLERFQRIVILLGVDGWDDLFKADPQLYTRISHSCQLDEFALDSDFIGSLRALDAAIPMPEPAGLGKEDNKDLASRIYRATHGNWRQLITLLGEALMEATRRKASSIGEEHLWWAYKVHFGLFGNPFDDPTPK